MAETLDWRTQLNSFNRQRIVSKINDTIQRHLAVSSPEDKRQLQQVAVRFEEKIYSSATSQSDYLRRISLKMLTMEARSEKAGVVNVVPQNPVANNQNPPYPAHAAASAGAGVGVGPNYMMDAPDWRIQLPGSSRERIVNKIMDTLKRHLPISGHEGLQELKKIAIRFEEKMYHAATSQSDYLRLISLKMLSLEAKSQNTGVANSKPQNPVASNQIPPDSGTGNRDGLFEEIFPQDADNVEYAEGI